MAGLEASVRAAIAASGAVRVGVAAGPVGAPRTLVVAADEPFHAASTMKVAVLLETYRRAWAGTLSLDEPLRVRNDFRSLVDGTPYALDPADDSEVGLYARVGQAVSIRELAFLMITVSSN